MQKEKDDTCCQVEAIVSFDERGQLVIPKDVRKKFGLNAGDKFALISCYSKSEDGMPCCFTLVKTRAMDHIVRQTLSPMFKDIVNM